MRILRRFTRMVQDFWHYQPWYARVPALPLTIFIALIGALDEVNNN